MPFANGFIPAESVKKGGLKAIERKFMVGSANSHDSMIG